MAIMWKGCRLAERSLQTMHVRHRISSRHNTVLHRKHRKHDQTHPSPLTLRTRLGNTVRLLQTSTTRASSGSPTSTERVTELVRELAARLVDFFAALEHAAAVLPCLGWRGHFVFEAVNYRIELWGDADDQSRGGWDKEEEQKSESESRREG